MIFILTIQIMIFILAFQIMILVNLVFDIQTNQREIFTVKEFNLNLVDFDQIKSLIKRFRINHFIIIFHYFFQKYYLYKFNQMIENYLLLT